MTTAEPVTVENIAEVTRQAIEDMRTPSSLEDTTQLVPVRSDGTFEDEPATEDTANDALPVEDEAPTADTQDAVNETESDVEGGQPTAETTVEDQQDTVPPATPEEQATIIEITREVPLVEQLGIRLVKVSDGVFAIATADKVPYHTWNDMSAAKRARRIMRRNVPIDDAAIESVGRTYFLGYGPATYPANGDPRPRNGRTPKATGGETTTGTPPVVTEPEAPTKPLVDLTVPLDITGDDVTTLLNTYEPKNERSYARKCLAAMATEDAPAPPETVKGLGRAKAARIRNEVALLRDDRVWAYRSRKLGNGESEEGE